MQLLTVQIDKPDEINFILGQSHFIKTVEDIHEALVQAVPGIKFGLAFCESSGAMLGALERHRRGDDRTGQAQRPGALRRPQLSFFFSAPVFSRSTCSTRSKWFPKSAASSAPRRIRSKS